MRLNRSTARVSSAVNSVCSVWSRVNEIERAGPQLLLRQLEGTARALHRVALNRLRLGCLLNRNQGLLDIGEGGQDCFPIGLQKLILQALLQRPTSTASATLLCRRSC
jgi:hypothetical protein